MPTACSLYSLHDHCAHCAHWVLTVLTALTVLTGCSLHDHCIHCMITVLTGCSLCSLGAHRPVVLVSATLIGKGNRSTICLSCVCDNSSEHQQQTAATIVTSTEQQTAATIVTSTEQQTAATIVTSTEQQTAATIVTSTELQRTKQHQTQQQTHIYKPIDGQIEHEKTRERRFKNCARRKSKI